MDLMGRGGACAAAIDAVVIRADGTRVDLGRVAFWHRSPWQRAGYALRHLGARPDGKRPDARTLARLLRDATGATVLTHAGKAIVTDRIKGAGGPEPAHIGWGTGAGTAAAGDTTLFTEKAVDLAAGTGTRTAGSSSRTTTAQANDTYQVTGTRTATGAGTVTNAGLFDNNAIGAGSLFMKGDFAGIGLAAGDSIAFTLTVQVA